MYLLYYAGMAPDQVTEQIGLAVSKDGVRFERVKGHGLIVDRDPRLWWKDTRVCNPAVVSFRGELLMFYHAAHADGSGRTLVHTIGIARSRNGVDWECSKEPVLSPDDVRENTSGVRPVGVIEPCVLADTNALQMWFIYYASSYLQSVLYHATSTDGYRWTISKDPCFWLASAGYTFHYPQVVKKPSGDALWVTLRRQMSGGCGIFKGRARPSRTTEDLTQITPIPRLPLSKRLCPGTRAKLEALAARTGWNGSAHLGYAHSHLMEENELFYHAYHVDRKGRWMDIGRCLFDGSSVVDHRTCFVPSGEVDAWDSFFVADPFVLIL